MQESSETPGSTPTEVVRQPSKQNSWEKGTDLGPVVPDQSQLIWTDKTPPGHLLSSASYPAGKCLPVYCTGSWWKAALRAPLALLLHKAYHPLPRASSRCHTSQRASPPVLPHQRPSCIPLHNQRDKQRRTAQKEPIKRSEQTPYC